MTEHAHAEGHAHHGYEAKFYIKMWGVLCVLLIISFVGPFVAPYFGDWKRAITMLTAFGIAIVKAYIVCAYFMHLKIERKYAAYLLITTLLLVGLFWGGVAGDVMNHQGQNWNNVAGKAETAKAMEYIKATHGDAHAPARRSGMDPAANAKLGAHHGDAPAKSAGEHH